MRPQFTEIICVKIQVTDKQHTNISFSDDHLSDVAQETRVRPAAPSMGYYLLW